MASNITSNMASNIDEVQSHILGVIVGLMNNYELTPSQVNDRFDYVASLELYPNTTYIEYKNHQTQPKASEPPQEEPTRLVWADLSSEEDDVLLDLETDISSDDSDVDTIHNPTEKIQVKTRREFCAAMSNGIKICPKYSNCSKDRCKNFHIKQKYICSHNTRGSYCDNNDCELIVIRPCRKGKRCHDPECSFRHK